MFFKAIGFDRTQDSFTKRFYIIGQIKQIITQPKSRGSFGKILGVFWQYCQNHLRSKNTPRMF